MIKEETNTLWLKISETSSALEHFDWQNLDTKLVRKKFYHKKGGKDEKN